MTSEGGRQVEVLVDFDNVATQRVRTDIDAEGEILTLSNLLGPHLAVLYPDIISASIHLYGAWRWADGTVMRERTMLSTACARLGTSAYGFPLVLQLADVWPAPRAPVSSYMQDAVCRCRYRAATHEQKLVDTMMVCDIIHYASFEDFAVVVVTADHDMIPGLAHAAHLRRQLVNEHKSDDVVWLRPRPVAGIADDMLAGFALIATRDIK